MALEYAGHSSENAYHIHMVTYQKTLSETRGHITFITETPHMVFCESETDGAT